MADQQTINVYDSSVDSYKKMVNKLPDLEPLQAFIAGLPEGADVLDWGSGPGYLASRMRDAGLNPVCVDASAEMVAAARDDYGLVAKQAQFSALDEVAVYHGIWANFSLLHARRDDVPDLIKAASVALLPSGLLYLAVKSGTGETRDDLGRLYTYFIQNELEAVLEQNSFRLIRVFTGRSAGMSGKPEDWFGLLAGK